MGWNRGGKFPLYLRGSIEEVIRDCENLDVWDSNHSGHSGTIAQVSAVQGKEEPGEVYRRPMARIQARDNFVRRSI